MKPTKMQLGGWIEMTYIDRLEAFGLVWYLVESGFGGDGRRVDWVADIPGVCLSVHRYNFRSHKPTQPGWGYDGDRTRDEEMIHNITRAVDSVHYQVVETTQKLERLLTGQARLISSAEQIKKGSL